MAGKHGKNAFANVYQTSRLRKIAGGSEASKQAARTMNERGCVKSGQSFLDGQRL